MPSARPPAGTAITSPPGSVPAGATTRPLTRDSGASDSPKVMPFSSWPSATLTRCASPGLVVPGKYVGA